MDIIKKDQFKINMIIYINTEHSNYLEANLNQDILNFSGDNGKGKTSKIKALKMLLTPENNFRDATKKYGFVAKNNLKYENKEAYNFYFPDDRSYIISEHENEYGVFCQLLMKDKNELSIARGFVPLPYKEIKEWFMKKSDIVDNEKGYVATKIINDLVKEKIKESGGIVVTDKNKMKDLMFFKSNLIDIQEKYNIIKLERPEDDGIDLFANILEMLLNGMKNESVKDIIINLCKSNNLGKGDMDLKINDQIEKFEEIIEKINSLNKKKNHYQTYKKLKDLQEEYLSYSEIMKNVFIQNDILKREEQCARDKEQIISDELKKTNEERDRLNENYSKGEGVFEERIKNKEKEINKNNLAIIDKNKKIESYLKNEEIKVNAIKEVNTLFSELNDKNDLEILNILTKKYNELSENIKEGFKNDQGLSSKLKSLKNDIIYHEKEIKKLNNEKYSIENQSLTDLERKELITVNEIFNYNFSIEEYKNNKGKISQILSCFNIADEKINLNSVLIGKIIYKENRDIKSVIEELEENKKELTLINNLKEEVEFKLEQYQKEKNEFLTNRAITERKINKIKNLISDLKLNNEIDVFNYKENIKERDRVVNENEIVQNEINILINEYNEFKEKKHKEISDVKVKLGEIDAKNRKNKEKIISLNIKRSKINPIIVELNYSNYSYTSTNEIKGDLDENFFETIIQENKKRNNVLEKLIQTINSFVNDEIILPENNEWLEWGEKLPYKEIKKSIEQLDSQFEDLERNLKLEEESIETDRQSIVKYLTKIINMKKIVETKIREVNESIDKNGKNTSSIEGFKINYKINSTIETLCVYSAELVENKVVFDQEKYRGLISYLHDLTKNLGDIINYSNVVDSVSINILQNGKEVAIGSEGTQVMLNILFVSSVFDELLLQKGTSMQLPIIVDEIGKLDDNNKYKIISLAKEKDYRLIATTPSLSFNDPDIQDIDILDINLSCLYTEMDMYTGSKQNNDFIDRQTYFDEDKKEFSYNFEKISEDNNE